MDGGTRASGSDARSSRFVGKAKDLDNNRVRRSRHVVVMSELKILRWTGEEERGNSSNILGVVEPMVEDVLGPKGEPRKAFQESKWE